MCPVNPNNKCEDCSWSIPPHQGIFDDTYSCAIIEIHERLNELSPIIKMMHARMKDN